ncbi:MAG TPA: NAD(+) diphosphatase [Rectinemataceae bacterium]|nr:NAD(+) diphosphatase [Rectinemataceae bacterium]
MDEPAEVYAFSSHDLLLPVTHELVSSQPTAGTPVHQSLSSALQPDGPPVALSLDIVDGLPLLIRREFEWEGRRCLAVSMDEAVAQAARLARLPLRQALGALPAESLRPALKAAALINWMEGAVFCGACGALLVDDHESSGRRCPTCGRTHFPRISPAVIVLIRRGDEALFARNARFPGNRFGLVAGFVEPGESLEETVHREVREEAGIEVGELRYVRSQPWPFPDSLMLAYTARWVSGEAQPDGEEIVELRWCRAGELPSVPPPGSVARWLIDSFVRGEL